MRRLLLALASLAALSPQARATEVGISAQALERTLKTQLFNSSDGRYYLRGDNKSACFVYAENPRVTFFEDRVVIHIHTRAKLGTSLRGACIGVSITRDVDASVLPDAEGETIGFRDARIDHLSDSRELNFLLVPFLSRQLPQQMKVNAADLDAAAEHTVLLAAIAYGTALRAAAAAGDNAARIALNPGGQQSQIAQRDYASQGGARASGGPVMAGTSYLVGEHGPELLRMGAQGGQVYNAQQTAGMLGGSSGGTTNNYDITVHAETADEGVTRALNEAAWRQAAA